MCVCVCVSGEGVWNERLVNVKVADLLSPSYAMTTSMSFMGNTNTWNSSSVLRELWLRSFLVLVGFFFTRF